MADDCGVRRDRPRDPRVLRDRGEARRASRQHPESRERNGVTRRAVLVALCAALWPFVVGGAQGVTTGVVSGRVVDESGNPVAGASISVVNTATGAASRTVAARDGRYLVTGLDVGGPYSVTVRHPGYQSQMRDGQVLTLSQNLTLDFRLERQTIILST